MNFRLWCQQMWYEHVEESSVWEGVEPTGTANEYFNKYKWWLKREYRHKQQKRNVL
jgi:hypothetical protein